MKLVFWGTRGSLPMNTPEHRVFGGNTSCVEVQSATQRIIFDGGSGLVRLGTRLATENIAHIDIFFSHFHSDHICGLPFFKPLFNPACTVRLHSFGTDAATMHDAVSGYLRQPIFPISPKDFTANVQFVHHDAAEIVALGDITISALAIPHPGGAHALKAGAGGKCFVYATDTEHTPERPNRQLIAFMRHADMAVYDCTFDDNEFEARRGWGHSTWQEGLRLAKAAQVRQFGIFHHEPERTDTQLAEIENTARAILPNAFVTRDFMTLEL